VETGQFSDAEEGLPRQGKNDVIAVDDSNESESDYEASDEFDEDYEFDHDEDNYKVGGSNVIIGQSGPNRQPANANQGSSKVTKFQPAEKVFKRFADKINVERYHGPKKR